MFASFKGHFASSRACWQHLEASHWAALHASPPCLTKLLELFYVLHHHMRNDGPLLVKLPLVQPRPRWSLLTAWFTAHSRFSSIPFWSFPGRLRHLLPAFIRTKTNSVGSSAITGWNCFWLELFKMDEPDLETPGCTARLAWHTLPTNLLNPPFSRRCLAAAAGCLSCPTLPELRAGDAQASAPHLPVHQSAALLFGFWMIQH